MIVYKLFTKKILKVQIQETDPISWADRSESKRKAHGGKFCTLCPRYKKRAEVREDGSEVVKAITLKPIIAKASDPDDARTVMVVVDATSASKSVTGMVEEIRNAGFGGRIVIDFVTKCGGGRVDQVKDQHINKCRPHLAYTYHATAPDLVLLCGTRSTKAFLGETVSVHKNRDLWQVMFEGKRQIPVVMTQSPIDAAGNFLLRKQMRRDLHFLFNTDWESYRLPQGEVREVETEEDAYEALKWAKQAEWLAYDTETTGRAFKGTMEILCVAFATTASNICYVFSAKSLTNRYIRGVVEKILTKCWLVGHNVKFDQHSVREGLGVEAKRVLGCTRLMHKLINSDADASLEQLGRLVGIGNHKRQMDPEVKRIAAELKAKAKEQAGRALKKHEFDPMSEAYGHVNLEDLHRYCALDTYVTAMLYDRCYEDLVHHDFLLDTWTNHQLLANDFFYRMEMRGMPTSARNIKIANRYVSKKVEESYEKIALLTEFKLDPDKPASITKYLKDNDLDTGKRTETGKMSTTAKDLKKLREKSTTIAHLLDYRKSSKLLHSYIETLPHFVGTDGCVHPSILVDGTRAGGRVSCIAGHQEIATSIGKVSFSKLAELDLSSTDVLVTTHTGKRQRIAKVWSTGTRPVVRVMTANGHTITCTPDHLLLTTVGWMHAAGRHGKYVKVWSSSGALYYDLVVSVEPAGECEVYDFTVPGDASAMIGGIAAHNCRDPAMQTIPSGKDDLEMSKMVKSCFVAQPTDYGADEGEQYVIISADFKTLEIYVGAAWSNDRVMLTALKSGKDFHIHTAMGIAPFVWKQTPEEVYAEIMRDLASPTGSSPKRTLSKRLTFSTMYRMGAQTLAEELGVPVSMAQDMITAFFKLNHGLSDRMDESLKQALKTGYVYAEWDGKPFRQRPLTHIGYRDTYRNGSAERASMNTPIQSQAADICTRAAMELEATFIRELPKDEAWIALTIHDSINVMARYRSAEKVMGMMRDVMTSQPCGDVKLVVDIEIGKTWGSMISEKAWRNGEEIKAA